jgi:hypothetical protein
MSFYTNKIKNHQIDPVFDSVNFRSEFRLDVDRVYLSNMRLVNIGVNSSTSNQKYQNLTGSYGIIKDIQLLDGGKVLDEIKEFQKLIAFLNYKHSNDNNKSKTSWANRSGYGYELVSGYGPVNDPANPDDNPVKYGRIYPFNTTLTTGLENNYGWLSLKEIFGFLGRADVIPTTLFKRLKLVINYSKNNVLQLPGNYTTPQPILLVDEVVDEQLASTLSSSFKLLNYSSLEHDKLILPSQLPSSGTEVNQNVNFRVNGFNGKMLSRLLLINSPTTQTNVDNNINGSASQLNERVQVRINGKNKLPFNGITRPNERLQLLTQTWGMCNTVQGVADIGTSCVSIYLPSDTMNQLVGQQDYFGMQIGEKVEDFQLEFERTCPSDPTLTDPEQIKSQYNQQLDLDLFAEVNKTLIVDKDNYVITYDGLNLDG